MKNRVLYGLVGLMVVSLVGIIVLQVIWVSKAIEDQETEFSSLVNTALNEVNTNIDESEALFFLEDEMFGLEDSLKINQRTEKSNDPSTNQNEDRIEISYSPSEKRIERKEISVGDRSPQKNLEEIEVHYEKGGSTKDSIVIVSEGAANKLENMTTVVRRFVMEHDFSGNLSERISFNKLDSLINKQLSIHGILAQSEFTVMNMASRRPVSGFTSEKYKENATKLVFKKNLFPNDRSSGNKFELAVQFNDTTGFVWSGILSIVLLCVLFTLLILTCFGYSLYFIFKQKKMSQVKNDFINNMTHELKTPLASISLAASSIEHPGIIERPGEIQRFVKIIQSEERRMNEHVERVLDMAALDHQELPMKMDEIDLLQLVHEAMKLVEHSVASLNGSVVIDTKLETANLQADRFHLLNALINVLDNSIKYRKEPLKIRVELVESSNSYSIRIRDNGIGMKKAVLKRVFDKFYREETGNIHTRKGFGLGLSYVKSILEAHSGSVKITSEFGEGSIVTLNLPKR